MELEDKVVSKFNINHIKEQVQLPLICIYKHPADYPNKYIARLWDAQHVIPTHIITMADTLVDIRQTIPASMVPLQRDSSDDQCIIESWI